MTQKTKGYLAAMLLLLHTLTNGLHTISHLMLNIVPPLPVTADVVIVTMVAPLLALVLLFTRQSLLGIWLFVLSMTGSLLTGMLLHFVLPGLDNVAYVHHGLWAIPFQASATLLVPLEVLGIAFGIWMLLMLSSPEGRPSKE